jgi:hypothetical protein
MKAPALNIQTRASLGSAVHLTSLSLGATAVLDVADQDLVINNASYSDIRNLVFAGFGTNSAITSSTSDGTQILALFDNALVGVSDWSGRTISGNAIVGKYTYFGDVNFDGQVTGDDYTVIDSNLNTTPPVGFEWLSGDANLDTLVSGDDYTTIDSNLGLGTGNPLTPARFTLSAVPEPRVAAIAGGLFLATATSRRAKSSRRC